MRIVELLNEGVDVEPPPRPSSGGEYEDHQDEEREGGDAREEDERQRAFGELLVTGASARFFHLTRPAKGATVTALRDSLVSVSASSSWGKTGGKAAAGEREENPLYLLLRATQEAVEKDKQQRKKEEEEAKARVKEEEEQEEQGDEQERGLRRRRAKQRVVFRRCYYKKINTLAALRAEHGELQAAFAELLSSSSARRRHSRVGSAEEGTKEGGDAVRDRYIALLVEKEVLRRQREGLADDARAQAKTRDTLQWLVDAELKAVARDDATVDSNAITSMFPTECLGVPPMSKAEATALASEFRAFMLQCRRDGVLERLDGDKDESSRAYEGVLGWETWCVGVEDANLGPHRVLSSGKRVEAGQTPLELCRRSLELLTSSRRLRDTEHEQPAGDLTLLTPWAARGADVTIVQTIDADHVLIYLRVASSGGLWLCSCEPMPTDSGEGCMLAIQPVEWDATNGSDNMASMGRFRSVASGGATRCWISVEQQRKKRRRSEGETSGAPCDLSIHYTVPQSTTTCDRSLMIDAARACCQWEARVVGALFDLGPASSCSSSSSSPP